ncbi:MAG TPA: hypothetical protein VK530_19230 [Candidatus Acidoferrum sp.]|nr:hypothetical protein [Candidatus Acidoferrum sp.]
MTERGSSDRLDRLILYSLAVLALFISALIFVDGLPSKPLDRFTRAQPVASLCWLLGQLFAGFYIAAWLSVGRSGLPVAKIAGLSAVSALIFTLLTIVGFFLAISTNVISVN